MTLAVNFLALLGQVEMAGKVVLEGKASLGDWGAGIRRLFFKVLGIGLIFLGLLFTLSMVVVVIYALTIIPKLITPEGAVRPPIAPASGTAYMGLALAAVIALAQSIFYMWLAPAVLEDRRVGASLDSGLKSIKRCGRLFIGFVALFSIASIATALIKEAPSLVNIAGRPLVGSLTPVSIISQIVEKILSPLWFLMAFTMHHSMQASEPAVGDRAT